MKKHLLRRHVENIFVGEVFLFICLLRFLSLSRLQGSCCCPDVTD